MRLAACWLLVPAVLLGGASCTHQQRIDAEDLRGLPSRGGEAALVGPADQRVRLDPNSRVRLVGEAGEISPRVHARDLLIHPNGILIGDRRRVPRAVAAKGAGLGGRARELLRGFEERGVDLSWSEDGRVSITAETPDRLRATLRAYLREVAEKGSRRRDDQPSRTTSEKQWRLRQTLKRIPPAWAAGTWYFRDRGSWIGPIEGYRLEEAMRRGASGYEVWPWDRIADVRVANVDGPRSLAATVLTLGLAAVLAPFWALGEGGDEAAHLTDAPRPSGGDAGALEWRWLESRASDPRGRERVEEVRFEGEPSWSDANPLFDAPLRRRSLVALVVAADAGLDPVSDLTHVESVHATARLVDLLETGGGVRRLSTGEESTLAGYFRLGGIFPMDAAHAWWGPLHIDLGSDGDGLMLRVETGLRWHIHDRFFAALLPFSPTYLQGSNDWSFPTSLQVGGIL